MLLFPPPVGVESLVLCNFSRGGGQLDPQLSHHTVYRGLVHVLLTLLRDDGNDGSDLLEVQFPTFY